MSSSANPRRKNEIDVIKQNLHGLVRSHKPVKYHDGNDDPVVSDFFFHGYMCKWLLYLTLHASCNCNHLQKLYLHFSQ